MRALLGRLAGITGTRQVMTDPDVMATYVTDWTGRYHGAALAVVRPGSAEEAAAVLAECTAAGVPVIPQGGNTGLVGGSVPGTDSTARPPIVLSLRRLAVLDPVEPGPNPVVRADAGVTIADLREHARAAGLEYGVDLAARDSATVGGTIATNAAGLRAVRYGPTRDQVAGVTAVLADGSVIESRRASFDPTALLAGSEGTLAVITAARLRLHPAESASVVLLAGVPGPGSAASLAARLAGLRAAEYLDGQALDLVCRVTGRNLPVRPLSAGYLVAELAGDDFAAERVTSADLPAETVIATGARDRASLWAYRERITESVATAGVPHKIDVAIPVAHLDDFRADLDSAVRAAAGRESATVLVFGHVAVGNLHVNILGPDPASAVVDEAVGRLAVAHGGFPAAEHGFGRAKAAWQNWARPTAEIAAMRAIKTALDPRGLLNPGVLLPPV